jgi:hypothetical protein
MREQEAAAARHVSELEGRVAAEVRARVVLEQQMKRAFMRGVCALNQEVRRAGMR